MGLFPLSRAPPLLQRIGPLRYLERDILMRQAGSLRADLPAHKNLPRNEERGNELDDLPKEPPGQQIVFVTAIAVAFSITVILWITALRLRVAADWLPLSESNFYAARS